MKTIALILALASISFGASFSQLLKDSSGYIVKETDKDLKFQTLLRSEFSRIATSSNQGVIGNYVGISTTDNNLSFNYNFVRKNHLLELSLKGGISDNISTLFEAGKLNTGIDFSLTDRVVFTKHATLTFATDDLDAIVRDQEVIERKYKLDLLSYQQKVDELNASIAKKKNELSTVKKKIGQLLVVHDGGIADNTLYTKDQQTLMLHLADSALIHSKIQNITILMEMEINRLRNLRDASNNTDPQKMQQFIVDSIKVTQLDDSLDERMKACKKVLDETRKSIARNIYTEDGYKRVANQLAILEQEIKNLEAQEKELTPHGEPLYKLKLYNDFEKKRKANLAKQQEVRSTDIRVSWLSYGISASNQDFNLFDTSRAFAEQIYRQNDLIPSFFAGYTFYSNRADETSEVIGARHIRYFSVTAKVKYGNNLGSLKQVDVHTIDSISPNRSTRKVDKAYQGFYEDEVVTALFSGDYYQFIGHKDNIGFHIQATVQLGPFRPVTSLRGGLIFAALDNKEGKSLINFEVFYGLNHIFQHNGEQTLFNRNVAGIQATLPFNFNLK